GIRMALGAERGAILELIAGQTLKLVVAGIALGLAGSFILTRFVASELYKISPTDPLTLALVSLVLLGIGVVSALVPASRATRIDPAETLRAL
ncbi:MAG: FtsX-like permease family protein, partial [Candidatus Dormibacteraceae bacterium]